MPIVASIISSAETQSDNSVLVWERHTDHLNNNYYYNYTAQDGAGIFARMTARVPEIEEYLAWREVEEQISVAISGENPDKVAEHQTQAEFDRRFLGRSMILNAQPFYNCKPVYDRVQTQGANAKQRAAYLGVLRTEYDLVNARFNNVTGIAWFLDDEKGMQWEEINEAFL